jgi:hypothetical protein
LPSALAFPFDGYGPYAPYPGTVYAPLAPNEGFFGPRPMLRHVRKRPELTAEPATSPASKSQASKPQPKPPAGPLIIAVSIGSQHVTVFDNGSPIATAPISTGMPGHPTPTGIFSIIQKEKWHRSNIYSNAPMPYMQRITWSGVALHAGVLPGYPASHGCIRLPEAFAIRLWGMTRMGARVVVTRNDATPFEIEHAFLATLYKPAPETAAVPDDASTRTAALTSPASGQSAASSDLGDGTAGEIAPPQSTGVVQPTELRPGIDPAEPAPPVPLPQSRPADAALRAGPISLFVSRKEGKLFVRKGFAPVFDAPLTIARRDEPLGTHVFTAGPRTDGGPGLRWLAVSMPTDRAAAEPPVKGKTRNAHAEASAAPANETLRRSAVQALDRIELPQDVVDRIVPLVTPGASLTISDQGLGGETGKETDFIVVTR